VVAPERACASSASSTDRPSSNATRAMANSSAAKLAAYLVGRYVPIEEVGGLPIPGILPGAAAFMLFLGVFASLGPARRGLRIDPTEALRSE